MMAILGDIPLLLQALFAVAEPLARQTGFVQRLRQLQPAAFVRTFCLFLLQRPKASLEQLATELTVSASALRQRLAAPAAATFLRAMLGEALHRLTTAALPPAVLPVLQRFRATSSRSGIAVPSSRRSRCVCRTWTAWA